jgi:LysM repeat protein
MKLRVGQTRLLLIITIGVLALACGQVITRPTPTPTPPIVVALQVTPRPTATPAPYTPEPTATPTITPTPVIYIVQRGDNLLRIAAQFGVSVEALQEANGIFDPRRLQIGESLIIPQEEEEALSEESPPTPTPTPMPFRIQNLTFHRAPTGELWCLGEVFNTSDVPLEQIQVEITLLDEQKQELERASAFVQADLVEPGERAPFMVQFEGVLSPFASYRAVALGGVPAYVGSYYRDLEVREVHGAGERYAAYRVTGRIANIGPEEAVSVHVIVTVYDALGRVIGVRREVPQHNVIPRGGETTFEVEIAPIGGPVVTYTVLAQGRRLPTPTPGGD